MGAGWAFPPTEGKRTRSIATLDAVCHHCDGTFRPVRPHQVYCSDACRLAAFKARQAALDFTPEPILIHTPKHDPGKVRKLAQAALQILGLLGDGQAHSRHELYRVGGARYSARVEELRAAGHRIKGPSKSPTHGIYETELMVDGVEMYRLEVR